MTAGGVCLLSGKVRNRTGVREAKDVGGMASSLRLPNIEERDASREFLCACCQRGPHDRGHGCCDLAGFLAREGNMLKQTPESRKTCLLGDTSFMHLKTEENRKRDVEQARPAGRRTSEWQRGKQQFSGTGPRTWWNSRGATQKVLMKDQKGTGRMWRCLSKTLCEGAECHPPQQRPHLEQLMLGYGGGHGCW